MESAAERMVETQLRRRGIADARVLDAMKRVPREHFVTEAYRSRAYADAALPLSHGQTISQPLIVAMSIEALELKGDETVLEVGAGSGYQAALLGLLAKRVVAIEIVEALAERARERLAALNIDNVEIVAANGRDGWPEAAPYDGIVVAAASADIPPRLVEQLRDGGRLVLPLGGPYSQRLLVLTKNGDDLTERELCRCVFVPLVEGD